MYLYYGELSVASTIPTWMGILVMALSISAQLKYFLDQHDLQILDLINIISVFNSDDTKLLLTQITGNILHAILLTFKLLHKVPTPKILLISAFVSWESYIEQFNLMIQYLK